LLGIQEQIVEPTTPGRLGGESTLDREKAELQEQLTSMQVKLSRAENELQIRQNEREAVEVLENRVLEMDDRLEKELNTLEDEMSADDMEAKLVAINDDVRMQLRSVAEGLKSSRSMPGSRSSRASPGEASFGLTQDEPPEDEEQMKDLRNTNGILQSQLCDKDEITLGLQDKVTRQDTKISCLLDKIGTLKATVTVLQEQISGLSDKNQLSDDSAATMRRLASQWSSQDEQLAARIASLVGSEEDVKFVKQLLEELVLESMALKQQNARVTEQLKTNQNVIATVRKAECKKISTLISAAESLTGKQRIHTQQTEHAAQATTNERQMNSDTNIEGGLTGISENLKDAVDLLSAKLAKLKIWNNDLTRLFSEQDAKNQRHNLSESAENMQKELDALRSANDKSTNDLRNCCLQCANESCCRQYMNAELANELGQDKRMQIENQSLGETLPEKPEEWLRQPASKQTDEDPQTADEQQLPRTSDAPTDKHGTKAESDSTFAHPHEKSENNSERRLAVETHRAATDFARRLAVETHRAATDFAEQPAPTDRTIVVTPAQPTVTMATEIELNKLCQYSKDYDIELTLCDMESLTQVGNNGVTPIHVAASKGLSKALKYILECLETTGRSDMIDLQTSSRAWTPLHAAAYYNRAKCVRLLVDAGAKKKLRSAKGETPGCLAEARKNRNLLRILNYSVLTGDG